MAVNCERNEKVHKSTQPLSKQNSVTECDINVMKFCSMKMYTPFCTIFFFPVPNLKHFTTYFLDAQRNIV